jgi:hypothetical protein
MPERSFGTDKFEALTRRNMKQQWNRTILMSGVNGVNKTQ